MATEAQIAANRENAKKSTGPKTPEGKVKSAQNALKHGFRANIILKYAASVEDEQPDGFASLLLDLVERLQPDGPLEEFCVETVATCMWRLRRIVGEENNLIDELHADLENDRDEQELYRAPDSPELPPLVYPFLPKPEALLPLIRYESHLNRQRHAALRELNDLQTARLSMARRVAWPTAPAPYPSQVSPIGSTMPSPAPVSPAVSAAPSHAPVSPAVSPVPSLGRLSPDAPSYADRCASPADLPAKMPDEANRGCPSSPVPAVPSCVPSDAPANTPPESPFPVPNEPNPGPVVPALVDPAPTLHDGSHPAPIAAPPPARLVPCDNAGWLVPVGETPAIDRRGYDTR